MAAGAHRVARMLAHRTSVLLQHPDLENDPASIPVGSEMMKVRGHRKCTHGSIIAVGLAWGLGQYKRSWLCRSTPTPPGRQ